MNSTESILLLSDFDGTLAPIVSRPELAYLPAQTKAVLQRIIQRQKYAVGVISGRALDDLKARVKLQGIVYAGNYGLEVEDPFLKLVPPAAEASKPLLNDIAQQLSRGLEAFEGILVENKGMSLSVHYRLVNEEQTENVRDIFQRITGPALTGGDIQVSAGKKVYEITPAVSWHKGKMIDLLVKEHRKRRRGGSLLPFFLGDDVSDEEGFEAVDKHSGISIFVGEEDRQSCARYFLRSPDEVKQFLERLP